MGPLKRRCPQLWQAVEESLLRSGHDPHDRYFSTQVGILTSLFEDWARHLHAESQLQGLTETEIQLVLVELWRRGALRILVDEDSDTIEIELTEDLNLDFEEGEAPSSPSS